MNMPGVVGEDRVVGDEGGELSATGDLVVRAVNIAGKVDDGEGGLCPGCCQVLDLLCLGHLVGRVCQRRRRKVGEKRRKEKEE